MTMFIILIVFAGVTFAADPSEGIISAKQFGAICDGVVRHPDDGTALQQAIDTAFGPASKPNGRNYVLNKILRFAPGHCIISSPLKFSHLMGAIVEGSGEFTTTIENRACGDVIDINGAAFTVWRDMYLQTCRGQPGTVVDLNYDGSPGGDSLQGNKFTNMQFDGGHFGVSVGTGGYMGSENAFVDDHFIGSSIACLATFNYNALSNTVRGGNFQGCGIGIWVPVGSVPLVSGVGFQTSTRWDIENDRSDEAMIVEGVRTESTNFVYGGAVTIIADEQYATSPGFFAKLGSGTSTITGGLSNKGNIELYGWVVVHIDSMNMVRLDWLNVHDLRGEGHTPANIEIENVFHGPDPKAMIQQRRRINATGTYDYVVAPVASSGRDANK